MAIIFVRSVIMFAALIIAMRLMGKRQLGELELSELVVAVLISDFASHPLQDINIPILNGVIPVIVLLCFELLISGLTLKSARARQLLFGKPSIVIADGKINQREMRRNRFTLDELREELRGQAVLDVSKVKYAILETNGKLSVVLFPAETPVTPSQIGVEVDDPGNPTVLINDGHLLSENLKGCGKNAGWLKNELSRRGVSGSEEVYLMTIDSMGQVYFLAREDGK